ncbi:tetratricopeptide repeat protein [Pseudanabaena sp. FACHB-2040]|nr:tetratricopeptide repeat protein [Pseudanabaena sp. FACHB-2040]
MAFNVLGPFSLVGAAFWVWMLYDCLKNSRQGSHNWVWILLFLNVLGAALYFVICWMPNHPNVLPVSNFTNRWRLRDALWQAEAEVKNIGKAHQYIKLGDIHYQMGNREKAAIAYDQALEKEPENIKALWGAACIAMDCKQLQVAKVHLQTLVRSQPEFAYGDASMVYGQTLFQIGDLDGAKAHLQTHLKQWSHPQGHLLLAQIQQQQGQIAEARDTLETMIVKIKSSTPFQYRKNRRFVNQGEKLLKRMGNKAAA